MQRTAAWSSPDFDPSTSPAKRTVPLPPDEEGLETQTKALVQTRTYLLFHSETHLTQGGWDDKAWQALCSHTKDLVGQLKQGCESITMHSPQWKLGS